MPEPLSLTRDLAALQAYVQTFNALPFVTHFGLRAAVPDLEHVEVWLDPVQAIHRGGIQGAAVNGGILSSTFDLALGLPGLLRGLPDGRSATVQLSMSFMRAVVGERVRTVSWIAKAGSGLLFTEAETYDSQGRVCATASAVVRQLDASPLKREF
jgi:acyl-coenzyme A thioesterase PaaI-like protein